MHHGQRYSLGYFATLEDAATARREAAERLHGEFARHCLWEAGPGITGLTPARNPGPPSEPVGEFYTFRRISLPSLEHHQGGSLSHCFYWRAIILRSGDLTLVTPAPGLVLGAGMMMHAS